MAEYHPEYHATSECARAPLPPRRQALLCFLSVASFPAQVVTGDLAVYLNRKAFLHVANRPFHRRSGAHGDDQVAPLPFPARDTLAGPPALPCV